MILIMPLRCSEDDKQNQAASVTGPIDANFEAKKQALKQRAPGFESGALLL